MLYITNKSEIVLYKHGANNLKTAKMGVDPTEDFVNITVSMMDSKIKVYVNNSTKPAIEAVDSSFTSGYFGLMSDYCDARFDNVKYMMPEVLIDDFTQVNDQWISSKDSSVDISNGTLKLNGIGQGAGITPIPTMTLKEKVIANGNISFDMKINQVIDDASWAGCAVRTKTAEGFEASDGYQLAFSGAGVITLATKAGVLATGNSGIDFTKEFVRVRITLEDDMIKIYLNDATTPVIEQKDSTSIRGIFRLSQQQRKC